MHLGSFRCGFHRGLENESVRILASSNKCTNTRKKLMLRIDKKNGSDDAHLVKLSRSTEISADRTDPVIQEWIKDVIYGFPNAVPAVSLSFVYPSYSSSLQFADEALLTGVVSVCSMFLTFGEACVVSVCHMSSLALSESKLRSIISMCHERHLILMVMLVAVAVSNPVFCTPPLVFFVVVNFVNVQIFDGKVDFVQHAFGCFFLGKHLQPSVLYFRMALK
ncbi:hypothetical protein YC2023_011352 [Brassica napus]